MQNRVFQERGWTQSYGVYHIKIVTKKINILVIGRLINKQKEELQINQSEEMLIRNVNIATALFMPQLGQV